MKMFEYSVIYVDKLSIPNEKKTALKLLLARRKELTSDRKEVLDTVGSLADDVRKASGCESKKDGKPAQHSPKKPKSTPQTRNRMSKYEELVQSYLEHLKEAILDGSKSQDEGKNLTAPAIAKAIGSAFKAKKIESVIKGIERTDAWKNRKQILAPIYNTKTFRERQNTNSPYQ